MNRQDKRKASAVALYRRAFTLIELLITITILSVMVAMVLFAGAGVLGATRVSKTKATITKINQQIMEQWEDFASRRIPSAAALQGSPAVRSSPSSRVWAIREMMRMDMPQRYAEIKADPQVLGKVTTLNRIYRQFLTSIGSDIEALDFETFMKKHGQFETAECLWMVVTFGMTDEEGGTKQFRQDEVGDKDGDRIPEFHDAWGNPIRFLRTAPGFANDWDNVVGADPLNGAGSDLIKLALADPIDLLKLEAKGLFFDNRLVPQPYPSSGAKRATFALTPLVYSPGPDSFPGLISGPLDFADEPIGDIRINDPYLGWTGTESNTVMFGRPVTVGEEANTHVDNIHSHALEPN